MVTVTEHISRLKYLSLSGVEMEYSGGGGFDTAYGAPYIVAH